MAAIEENGSSYYEFIQNSTTIRPTINHPQLRNLLWATTKHDVYLLSDFSILHWLALDSRQSEVINLFGHVAPPQNHPRDVPEGFVRTEVTCFQVKDKLLVIGGSKGELICKHLDRPDISFCTKTNNDDDYGANAVEIYINQSGTVHFTASSDDSGLKDFDMENFQLSKDLILPWPVGHTSLSPDNKLLLAVGDHTDGIIVDYDTGKTLQPLRGHLGYSFATAWHPDGIHFATGSEDKTCKIWDIRNLRQSVVTLAGTGGRAIRSIRYSSDGQFMMVAESANTVHIYDTKSKFDMEQVISFIGLISGTAFSPDTESAFIGIADGSIVELGRYRHIRKYLYSFS